MKHLITWYVLAINNSLLGEVLAYSEFETEEAARAFSRAGRGEMADRFKLFLGEEIPHHFEIETISVADYHTEYGNRMPLNNLVVDKSTI
jgi:Mn-dependent DtxR family transcriptional regulator